MVKPTNACDQECYGAEIPDTAPGECGTGGGGDVIVTVTVEAGPSGSTGTAGYICGPDCTTLGTVFVCKKIDSDGIVTESLFAVMGDGAIVNPYVGPISPAPCPDDCDEVPEPPQFDTEVLGYVCGPDCEFIGTAILCISKDADGNVTSNEVKMVPVDPDAPIVDPYVGPYQAEPCPGMCEEPPEPVPYNPQPVIDEVCIVHPEADWDCEVDDPCEQTMVGATRLTYFPGLAEDGSCPTADPLCCYFWCDQLIEDAYEVPCPSTEPDGIIWDWTIGCLADGSQVRWIEGIDPNGMPCLPGEVPWYFPCVGTDPVEPQPLPNQVFKCLDPTRYDFEGKDIGCAFDADGEVKGKVCAVPVYDETDPDPSNVVNEIFVLYPYDGGTPIRPFDPAAEGCTIGPCPEHVVDCVPYIASFTGEAIPTVEAFNTFSIHKPDCCALTVITSAGTIVIPPGVITYSPECFSCELTSIEIQGDCIAETTIFVQHTGAMP